MLIDRLHIQAFRGIGNFIDLPLDASITVVLAANGTAKTSVCDAVEWLLTGRVRRIQSGLISTAVVKSRYSGNLRTSVHATAKWDGMTRELERTESESLQISTADGVLRKSTMTGKLLEELTPDYVGQTSRSRNVEEPRAEWLRAVRFFSPDGLALLLDDNEDAEWVRGLAFAELLGVGDVGRRIEELKGVRDRIDSPRAAIANALEKIAFFEAQLKTEQASASAPHLSRADTLLREVSTICDVALPETLTNRRELLLSLRDLVASAERVLEVHRTEHAKVKGWFAQYETALEAWKHWSQERKPHLEKVLRDAQTQREQTNREIQQLTTGTLELTNRLGQMNILLGQTQTALAKIRLDVSALNTLITLTVGHAHSERDEAKKKHQEALAQLERWKSFADGLAEGQRAYVQLDLLAKQRLDLLIRP